MNKNEQVRKNNNSKNLAKSIYHEKETCKLPDGYSIHNGYLQKGGTCVSLVTSGLVKIADQGFLHIDRTDEYMA